MGTGIVSSGRGQIFSLSPPRATDKLPVLHLLLTMKATKSISSRRGGGGGNERNNRSSLMHILFVLLFLIAGVAVHLNYKVFSSADKVSAANDGLTSSEAKVNTPLHNLSNKQSHVKKSNAKRPPPPSPKQNSTSISTSIVRKEYAQHLKSLAPFPKKLHILFPHKNYYKENPQLDFVKHGILRFIELNPTWNVTVYDDSDMDRIITRAADDGVISVEEKDILVGTDAVGAAHRKLFL